MKLENLTKEQQDIIPPKSEEWINIGVSTSETKIEDVEKYVTLAYQAANLSVPPIKIVSNPIDGINLTKKLTGSYDYSYFAGQFNAGWLSYYDTFLSLGLEDEIKPLEGLLGLGKICSWVWFYDKLCIVVEHPISLNRDAQGRLHSLIGPAIAFKNDFNLYFVNGVAVPEYVIKNPNKLSASLIKKEPNAEVRRVMMEIYGAGKFLTEISAKRRQEDQYGVLWDIPGDLQISICEVINSTAERDGHKKVYYLTVPSRMRCAHEAVAGSFGFTMDEYNPSAQS